MYSLIHSKYLGNSQKVLEFDVRGKKLGDTQIYVAITANSVTPYVLDNI